jgi:hypothetical protein
METAGKRVMRCQLLMPNMEGKVKTASVFDKTAPLFDKTAPVFDKTAPLLAVLLVWAK